MTGILKRKAPKIFLAPLLCKKLPSRRLSLSGARGDSGVQRNSANFSLGLRALENSMLRVEKTGDSDTLRAPFYGHFRV